MINRGYVWINIYPNGKLYKKCLGPTHQPGVIDEAIAKLNQMREQIRTGKFGLDEKVRRISMDDAVETFWNLHASKKDGAYVFRYQLNHIKNFFSNRFADSITMIDIQNYRREREKTIKPTTANREQTVITTLFNKLKYWKKLSVITNVKLPEDNPTNGIKKADERPYSRTRIVAPEEFQKFLNVAPESVRRICIAAVNTTLRWKTLKTLTKKNIYEAANVFGGTQSKVKKLYQVPINETMRKLIETAQGDVIFDFTNFSKLFNEARKKSKIPWFQFRDLRRTGARMMLQKGIDIGTVSKYLGHSDIKMTQIYVNPTQNDLQVAGAVIGSMYGYSPKLNTTKNTTKGNFKSIKNMGKVAVSV